VWAKSGSFSGTDVEPPNYLAGFDGDKVNTMLLVDVDANGFLNLF
jgi:hypothetical protein